MRSADSSTPSLHCHAQEAESRLASPCCCEIAPQGPAVAEALRAPFLLERPALLSDLVTVTAAAPERHGELHVLDRWIDRAPPPAFLSPLRI